MISLLWRFVLPPVLLICSTSSAIAAANACDESKCRATRVHPWVDDDVEWTCWVPQGSNATEMKCDDGYEGRAITASLQTNIQKYERMDVEYEVEWYTCCPQNYTGEVIQQCSDVACSSPDWKGTENCWADGFQEPMSCGDPDFRYPRWTGKFSYFYAEYICCTTPAQKDPLIDSLLFARIIWMVLSGISFLACTIFFLGVMSSRRTRSRGYNLYLVFLAIPDSIANLMILIRNYLSITGAPVSPVILIFLASVEYFYASSNMWLNAVVVRQIHLLLRKSKLCIRTTSPSVKTVCGQAATVYFCAAIWFGWAFFLYSRVLLWTSVTIAIEIWFVTRLVMVLPPLFYVLYVCWDVWWKNLLPQSGHTRVLSVYFLRVVIVFSVTWVPYYVIYEYAWRYTEPSPLIQISYYIGSLQGLVSVSVAMTKPDIKRAVLNFVRCREDVWIPGTGSSNATPTVSRPAQVTTNNVSVVQKDKEWEEDDKWQRDNLNVTGSSALSVNMSA